MPVRVCRNWVRQNFKTSNLEGSNFEFEVLSIFRILFKSNFQDCEKLIKWNKKHIAQGTAYMSLERLKEQHAQEYAEHQEKMKGQTKFFFFDIFWHVIVFKFQIQQKHNLKSKFKY